MFLIGINKVPKTKPNKKYKVLHLSFENKNFTTWLTTTTPTPAPNTNGIKLTKSKFLTSSTTYSYIPNITKIKLPEIPGKNKAKIAKNPDNTSNNFEGLITSFGEKNNKSKPQINPINPNNLFKLFLSLICLEINNPDAKINPVKKAKT